MPAAVTPERLLGWLAGLADRHGRLVEEQREPDEVVLTGADGSSWAVRLPFPPIEGPWREHVLRSRRVGLLLVRRGGWAVGVGIGPELAHWRLGRGYVQSRTAAGGWSQGRYARRREAQADRLVAAAAEAAADLFAPRADLEAIVAGGDRLLVRQVLRAHGSASLDHLITPRWLEVADPRLDVLRGAVASARSVLVSGGSGAG